MMCVRKVSSSCCIPLSGANRLSRKKRKRKKILEGKPAAYGVGVLKKKISVFTWWVVSTGDHNQTVRHHERQEL